MVWLLGGAYNEKGETAFSRLSNGPRWKQVSTCATSTTSHTQMRVEFYPATNGGTLEIDDVDVHQSLVGNGGFESGGWSRFGSSTNVVAYANGEVPGESARSGRHYLATNTKGGSVYYDVPVTTAAPGTYCGNAWVRTQSPGTGAGGSFVVWLLGGAYNEKGETAFSRLSNGPRWKQVSTCATSTTSHTQMRVEFYPATNGGTLEIDDVDVHQSLVGNGGFESGGWSRFGSSTNVVAYANGEVPGESARSGRHYLATNTKGGSVYYDVPVTTAAPGTYCGNAWVRTQSPGTGAGGSFVVWLLGGAYNEKGETAFSRLSNGPRWKQVSTCATSTTSHTQMRVEFYPATNGGTLEIDDVDVH